MEKKCNFWFLRCLIFQKKTHLFLDFFKNWQVSKLLLIKNYLNFRDEFVQCYCWNYCFSENCLKNILFVFTTLCINKKGSIKCHRPSENHQNMGSSMVFQQDHFVVAPLIKSSIPTILCTWYGSFYKTHTYVPDLISDWQSDTYIYQMMF